MATSSILSVMSLWLPIEIVYKIRGGDPEDPTVTPSYADGKVGGGGRCAHKRPSSTPGKLTGQITQRIQMDLATGGFPRKSQSTRRPSRPCPIRITPKGVSVFLQRLSLLVFSSSGIEEIEATGIERDPVGMLRRAGAL
jgi:hypothetical protein